MHWKWQPRSKPGRLTRRICEIITSRLSPLWREGHPDLMWSYQCKIQKNWCTVTVAPTIEHHCGHSRTPANQRCDQVPGRSYLLAFTLCLSGMSKKWSLKRINIFKLTGHVIKCRNSAIQWWTISVPTMKYWGKIHSAPACNNNESYNIDKKRMF